MRLTYRYSSISRSKLAFLVRRLAPYLKRLQAVASTGDYERPEGSINLPGDANLLRRVKTVAGAKVTRRLKYVVVVGIGGSSLGAQAIYGALTGYFDGLRPSRFPKMIFAESCEPAFVASVSRLLRGLKHQSEALIVVISKSGGTVETMANFEALWPALKSQGHGLERLIVITDWQSKLWRVAESLKLTLLAIPNEVGGRFSVFSAAGLMPLVAAGLDASELRRGAQLMRYDCLRPSVGNPAAVSAAILYYQATQGLTISDTFFFHPALEPLGKWYRQLVAESLGKTTRVRGRERRVGLTPTVSIGTTDLHSVAQLYLGGPRDKFTTFVSVDDYGQDLSVPAKPLLADISGLRRAPLAGIISAIKTGVTVAYRHEKLPFMEVVLPDISARSIAQFMQFKMIETMFLGYLFGVNAFDQPAVELYKRETRKLMNQKSRLGA